MRRTIPLTGKVAILAGAIAAGTVGTTYRRTVAQLPPVYTPVPAWMDLGSPGLTFNGLVNGQIVSNGGMLPISATFQYTDPTRDNTLFWHLEVWSATPGVQAGIVWEQDYPTWVLPQNVSAATLNAGTFTENLTMPPGSYSINLSVRDTQTFDGDTGLPFTNIWVANGPYATVNP
jgi:hypothetical protein